MRRGWLPYVVLGALLALVLVPWRTVHGDGPHDEKAMKKKMQGWSRDLGVKCSYCHVQEGRTYDYEAETPRKKIAHYCEENFVEKLLLDKRSVGCADCHQKKPRFLPREGEDAKAPPAPSREDEDGEDEKR